MFNTHIIFLIVTTYITFVMVTTNIYLLFYWYVCLLENCIAQFIIKLTTFCLSWGTYINIPQVQEVIINHPVDLGTYSFIYSSGLGNYLFLFFRLMKISFVFVPQVNEDICFYTSGLGRYHLFVSLMY